MRFFRKKRIYKDLLEQRLDAISDLTRDLEEPEFNRLIDATKAIFKARQNLKLVKTNEEKENADIYEAEKILAKELQYENNTLLEINFQNARCTYDTNKNMYVHKKKSTGKVDMVVSMLNALYLLQQDVFLNQMDFAIQVF